MNSRQYAEAMRLWAEGAKMKEIAAEVGCTISSLAHYTYRNREDFPRRRSYKTLTDDEVRIAAGMVARGMSAAKVARLVGVDQCTLRRRIAGLQDD